MRNATSTEIFSYWNSLRKSRRVPLRDEIDPGAIRRILPDLFILERSGAEDIRFRLAGTRVCALFGHELRSTSFADLWDAAHSARLTKVSLQAMDHMTPIVLSAGGDESEGERLALEAVLLPLSSTGGAVDRLIGSLSPLTQPHWLNTRPIGRLAIEGLRVLDPEKTSIFLQNRPEVPLSVAQRAAHQSFGQAIRKVLHLRVFEGGRTD